LVQLLQTTTTLHPRTMIWPAKTAISGPEWSQLTVHSSGNVPDSGSIFPSVVFRDANHRDLEPTCCQPGCCSAAEEWLALDPRWSSRMGAPVRSGLASNADAGNSGGQTGATHLEAKIPGRSLAVSSVQAWIWIWIWMRIAIEDAFSRTIIIISPLLD
jgi:hypothetical protein